MFCRVLLKIIHCLEEEELSFGLTTMGWKCCAPGYRQDKGIEIKANLEIEDNLTFKAFLRHQRISNTSISNCLGLKSNKINSVIEANNIAAYLGSKELLLPASFDTCSVNLLELKSPPLASRTPSILNLEVLTDFETSASTLELVTDLMDDFRASTETLMTPKFKILDRNHTLIYEIIGPCLFSRYFRNVDFGIFLPNGYSEKEIEEALSRVKEAQSLVAATVDPLMGMLGGSTTSITGGGISSALARASRSRSRSRRRSRSRGRSVYSTRRSRSRSRHRRRSRSRRRKRSRSKRRRSRSKERRSRSKDKRSRSRDKRSRSKDRNGHDDRRKSRSRSKSRERKVRSKSWERKKSRSRSRDRKRSRSISRKRSRSRSRDKIRRSKSHKRRSRSREKRKRSKDRKSSRRSRSRSKKKDRRRSHSRDKSDTNGSSKKENRISRDYDEEEMGYHEDYMKEDVKISKHDREENFVCQIYCASRGILHDQLCHSNKISQYNSACSTLMMAVPFTNAIPLDVQFIPFLDDPT
ncbi:unnamed protein product [Lepeophtheirus salmonis]|uniref:(salmon louse) hypothetical protein n=1 Tax=Lepeophtheirus salmonis TaxID=72036 RepID=A0A7R8CRL1_LEPSM|nr:unnamed protein product [Lepeophtheirus salmonis]CAF2906578.1 unnamed protein product [Lepeophtheirus salmonis]